MDAIFESRKPFRNVLCVQRRDPFYDVSSSLRHAVWTMCCAQVRLRDSSLRNKNVCAWLTVGLCLARPINAMHGSRRV